MPSVIISLVVAFFISVIVVIGCWPQLGRSLWVDEAMLFSNYPLSTVKAFLNPLPYYDQAATPFYNLLGSLLSKFDILTIRSVSLMLIVFTASFIMLIGSYRWRSPSIILLSLFASSTPLIMFSELKHYGLETVGVVVIVVWYMKKDLDSCLNIKDLLILFVGMLLGISTIIPSTVALGLFVAIRAISKKKLEWRDIVLLILFVFLAVSYYLIIKYITSYQMSNYALDAYANKDVFSNIKNFLQSLLGNLSLGGGAAVLLGLLLLLVSFRDHYTSRFLLLFFVVGLAFLFISGIGLYPVNSPRHVTWSVAFFYLIVFYSICLGDSKSEFLKATYEKVIYFGLIVLLVILSSRNIFRFWTSTDYEFTENNQAILFIRNLPPSIIGLWIGGQPIIQYYSRLYSDLGQHDFFGKINPLSVKIKLPEKNSKINDIDYQRLKSQPGGWSYLVMFRVAQDYTLPAKALIDEAPRGKEFYIFASHYDINADGGYGKSRVTSLHEALEKAQCDYKPFKNLKNITIYKAFCLELK